jgi:hypothetical protein
LLQANELSVKVGKLFADERAKLLAKLSTKDTKVQWSAVNKASSKTTGKNLNKRVLISF